MSCDMFEGVFPSELLPYNSLGISHHFTKHSLAEIFFTSEPQSYYYSLPDHITFIPCVAVRVDDAGDEFPITAVPYRNSERLTSLNKPERHHLHVTRGKVAGVVVSPTQYEDTGARYWCQVERGEQVVAESQRTQLVVGGEALVLDRHVIFCKYAPFEHKHMQLGLSTLFYSLIPKIILVIILIREH